jgi:hypothetical protein
MRFTFGLCFLSIALLVTGCGGSGDAIRDARDKPNSFGSDKNPANSFNESSTGDSGNTTGLAQNEVRITMEVPGSVAPDAEQTRRNLRIVQPDHVSVYATNPALQDLGTPDGVSTRTDSNGFTVITFANGLPLGPDVVIEASYGGTTFRALAADADRDVKVNPFSEYLVRKTLGNYTSGQFQTIMNCVKDDGGNLCLNKYVWSTLADQVHDFEIDIPANASVTDAMDLLANRGDFAGYVSAMAGYALLTGTSAGKISASSADYNSVFLGVELGQTFQESSLEGAGQWGMRTAQEETLTDANGTGYVYPALSLASFSVFDINVTSLASDIPYEREVLIHQAGDQFYQRGSDHWRINTHSSSPGAATLVDDTRLLAGRALYQSITGRGSSKIIGWTRNPYYLNAYTSTPASSTTGPDRVVSGYFSAGKAIELQTSGKNLKRGKTLEDEYVSAIEINLLRSGEEFKTDSITGSNYNTLYLAASFNDDPLSGPPLVIESGIGSWQPGSGAVSQTYRILQRNTDGSVTTDDTGTRSATWAVTRRQSRLSSGDVYHGRLNLDINTASAPGQQPDLGIGASTPDGSLMAFNLDDSPMGDGILIATRQTSEPAPGSGQYRLQGLAMGLGADTNHLKHFDNGVLTIQSGSSALLSAPTLNMVHSVSGETVSAPRLQDNGSVSLSYSSSANGRVHFKDTDSTSHLELDGVFTADKSQFYLVLRDTRNTEDFLGLMLATRIP